MSKGAKRFAFPGPLSYTMNRCPILLQALPVPTLLGCDLIDNNVHEDHRKRVRQRFMQTGLDGFAYHEVLELLLYYCYPRRDTNEIAHRMINEYGTLHNLFEADPTDIMKRCNTTQNVAVLVALIPRVAKLYFQSKWAQIKLPMDNAETVGQYAVSLFVGRTNEAFYVFCLDAGRRLNHVSLIAEGTLNETAVYPREIVGEALKHQAVSIILAHNHPGGTARPSPKDLESTSRIIEGLNFLAIRVIDHMVVAGGKYYSFATRDQFVEGY